MVICESLLAVGAKMEERYQESILISDKWHQVLGLKLLIVHMGMGSSMRGTVIHHIGVDSSIVILHMAMGSHNKGSGYSCKCNHHQQFMVILIHHMTRTPHAYRSWIWTSLTKGGDFFDFSIE